MPSLTKKIIRGKPYYCLRECQRVEGKPKIVSTIYLGPPQSILDRLLRPEPAQLAIYEFGASAAVWDMTDIHEVTLLYPGASGSQKPFARTVLADMDPTQRELVKILGLERYRSP